MTSAQHQSEHEKMLRGLPYMAMEDPDLIAGRSQSCNEHRTDRSHGSATALDEGDIHHLYQQLCDHPGHGLRHRLDFEAELGHELQLGLTARLYTADGRQSFRQIETRVV